MRPDRSSPLYRPLADLLLVAFGPATAVASELDGIAGIDEAHIFGSWAARYSGEAGTAPNDVDVLVIGDPDRDEVCQAAERAERRLRRSVQVTFRSPEEWGQRTGPVRRHHPEPTARAARDRRQAVTWERGRSRIDELLAAGELAQVAPNNEHANRLLADAACHSEPSTGWSMSTQPVPCNWPMTPPARRRSPCLQFKAFGPPGGGHNAVQDAVVTQSGGSTGMTAFARLGFMRRQRHAAEYPTESTLSGRGPLRMCRYSSGWAVFGGTPGGSQREQSQRLTRASSSCAHISSCRGIDSAW
ncbi:MAG: hypothetical protein LC792_22955 [Actinobacteria bacterium]|nr:hypothetical protein [Actinomycetota bacterium]